MIEYLVYFRDIVGGDETGQAQIIGALTYTEVLNTAGTCEFTIPLESDSSMVTAGVSAVYIRRSGAFVWGGIVWSVVPDVENKTLQVRATGWLSYLEHRVLNHTKDYYIADQTTGIVKDLIDQMETDSSVGWSTANIGASGVTRTLETIYFYERRIYADIINELASFRNGFDFGIVITDSGGAPALSFQTFYPRRGERRPEPLVWTGLESPGSNMIPASAEIDASSMAWKVHGIGRGDGYLTPTVTKTNSTFASAYPMLEAVISFPQVGLVSELSDLVDGELDTLQNPLERLSLGLRPESPVSVPGAFSVGDEFMVHIDDGWWQVSTWYRVESWTVTWNGSIETMSVEVQKDDS